MALLATKGMLWAAVALLVLVKYGRALFRMVRMFWKSRGIPGPPGYPPLGSFIHFAVPQDELADKTLEMQRRYGNTVRVTAGPVVSVVITEPEDIEAVMSHPAFQCKPSVVYDSLKPVLGLGLITLNGDEQRRRRKAITPSLHFEILQDFVPAFEKNAMNVCKLFDEYASTGEVFDAVPIVGGYSAHSICETVFSTEFAPEMEHDKAVFVKSLLVGSELMFYRAIRPWCSKEFIFYFTSHYNEFWAAANNVTDFISKMLKYKQDQVKAGILQTDRKRKAFLDHILSSSEGQILKPDELIEELKTVCGAAVGTSMDMMSSFVMAMAVLPDIQAKIVEELEDVFGDSDRPIEPEDLPHLQYLECTLKETLRLFPPVFTYSRDANQDIKIPSGYLIPEGSIISFLPFVTHRNPQHFKDPEKFDPTRFLPENTRGRHPFAFVPFSAGARNCIGQRYAYMAGKTLAANLLRRFRIYPCPKGPQKLEDIRIIAAISVTLKGGAKIRVERRTLKREAERRG